MSFKLELKVPEGADKIDIGPLLEPILRRIVHLEKCVSEEFKETREPDAEFMWKGVPRSAIPTTRNSVEQWMSWAHLQSDITDRLGRITHQVGRSYLLDNGWEEGTNYRRSYSEKQLLEVFRIDVKKYAYDYNTTHIVKIPFNAVERQLRIYYWSEAIEEIVRMYFSKDFRDGANFLEVLEEIEAYSPPLLQLANQAENK